MNSEKVPSSAAWRLVSGLVLILSIVGAVALTVKAAPDIPWDDLSPGLVAVLLVLQGAYLLTQAAGYLLVLHAHGASNLTYRSWTPVFVTGRLLNLVIPQAGTIYRGVELNQRFQVDYQRYLGSFAAFTWLTVILNLLASTFALTILGRGSGLPLLAPVVTLTAAVILLVSPYLFSRGLTAVASRSRRLSPLAESGSRIVGAALHLIRSRRFLVRFLAISGVGTLLAVSVFALAFHTAGVRIPLASNVVFFAALQMSTFINITPGNLGVQELGLGALAQLFGLEAGIGVIVGVLIRITGLIALAILGILSGGLKAVGSILKQRNHSRQ